MYNTKKGLAFLAGLFLLLISTLLPFHYLLELEQEASIHTSTYLGNNLQHGEILTLKIPFALPYASDWKEPLESEGLFEYEGEFYTVLSKNYKSDTIYFECIRNTNAREIFSILSDNVQAFTNGSSEKSSSSKSSNTIIKLLDLSYFFSGYSIFNSPPILSERVDGLIGYDTSFYISPSLSQSSPPPDFSFRS